MSSAQCVGSFPEQECMNPLSHLSVDQLDLRSWLNLQQKVYTHSHPHLPFALIDLWLFQETLCSWYPGAYFVGTIMTSHGIVIFVVVCLVDGMCWVEPPSQVSAVTPPSWSLVKRGLLL